MTNGNGNSNGNEAGASARQLLLRQLYVKDVSFESPSSPAVFNETFDPEVKLNLQTAHTQIDGDVYEVVLHLSVHARAGERSLFLVELDQAGLFELSGYDADEMLAVLGTHCPATLFPYARETISSLVMRGGFPPLLLQPINFESLFAQAQRARELA